MRIDIISVVPELLKSPFEASILKRAIDAQLVEVIVHNLRDYTTDSYKSVDDYQFGGGAGMVMSIEPIDRCITKLKSERNYEEIIYMTPDGELLDQGMANQLSLKGNLIVLCGHYKGVDQRVREHFITKEISIGDYVLSGGEIPAISIINGLTRLLPGTLGDPGSLIDESHNSSLLEYPHYTRPQIYREMKVPQILLSGNHKEIELWREKQMLARTYKKRKDLTRRKTIKIK